MSIRISRQKYADMYGPTTGDKVRLGDTELFIEIEIADLRINVSAQNSVAMPLQRQRRWFGEKGYVRMIRC